MGAAAWARRWPGDPAQFGGSAADRTGVALPCAPSSRGTGADLGGMEGFRPQPKGEVLSADLRRKEGAACRTVEMEAIGENNSARDASGMRMGPMMRWSFWRRKQREA